MVRPQTLQLAGGALHELVHFFVQFAPLFTFSLFTIHSTNTRAKEVEVKDFPQDTCCTWPCSGIAGWPQVPFSLVAPSKYTCIAFEIRRDCVLFLKKDDLF